MKNWIISDKNKNNQKKKLKKKKELISKHKITK